MEVTRKKVYESGHPIVDDDASWGESESVVVKLTKQEQYNDRVSVEVQSEEGTNKYEFEVLPDENRLLTYTDGESVPLGIRLYLSDFGYYIDHSADGPWGQYEYLVDAAGRFELRAKKTNNPMINYFFRYLSFRLQKIVVDAASETAVADEEYTTEQLVEATGMSDKNQLRLAHAFTELNKLPLSEDTYIPERFREMDLEPEIVIDDVSDESEAEIDISFTYDEKQDTTAVIVSLPYDAKYFKLNGSPGGSCSLEFTARGELPGPFIEDYMKEKADIEITNTPRLDPSSSDIELLSQARGLLNNIKATDGIRIPSDESSIEIGQMAIDIIELFLRMQQVVGTDRYLSLVDTVLQERTDTLTVENLSATSPNKFDTVVLLIGLANTRLDDTEKEQIEIEMDRKGLDEVDTDSIGVDDLTEYITEQITAFHED